MALHLALFLAVCLASCLGKARAEERNGKVNGKLVIARVAEGVTEALDDTAGVVRGVGDATAATLGATIRLTGGLAKGLGRAVKTIGDAQIIEEGPMAAPSRLIGGVYRVAGAILTGVGNATIGLAGGLEGIASEASRVAEDSVKVLGEPTRSLGAALRKRRMDTGGPAAGSSTPPSVPTSPLIAPLMAMARPRQRGRLLERLARRCLREAFGGMSPSERTVALAPSLTLALLAAWGLGHVSRFPKAENGSERQAAATQAGSPSPVQQQAEPAGNVGGDFRAICTRGARQARARIRKVCRPKVALHGAGLATVLMLVLSVDQEQDRRARILEQGLGLPFSGGSEESARWLNAVLSAAWSPLVASGSASSRCGLSADMADLAAWAMRSAPQEGDVLSVCFENVTFGDAPPVFDSVRSPAPETAAALLDAIGSAQQSRPAGGPQARIVLLEADLLWVADAGFEVFVRAGARSNVGRNPMLPQLRVRLADLVFGPAAVAVALEAAPQGFPYVGLAALTFVNEPSVVFSVAPEGLLGGAVSVVPLLREAIAAALTSSLPLVGEREASVFDLGEYLAPGLWPLPPQVPAEGPPALPAGPQKRQGLALSDTAMSELLLKEPRICEIGGMGILLPIFGNAEHELDQGFRGFLYLVGLLYLFCGIAVVSDTFMNGIERITSQKKRKLNPVTGRIVSVVVWNPTVANLTLMALGSSAPEILLSIIELLGNEMYSGELGPSTIVGSAAFNLLCIIAVCIVAIPPGEVRKIKEVPVYAMTAFFSMFAYLWLLFILLVTTPNIVDIWEGLLTFLFFPILIILAYAADRGYFGGRHEEEEDATAAPHVLSADMSPEDLAKLESRIRLAHGEHLSDEQVLKLLEDEYSEKTPSSSSVGNTRKVAPFDPEVEVDKQREVGRDIVEASHTLAAEEAAPQLPARISGFSFAYDRLGICESKRTTVVRVIRTADVDGPDTSLVNYQTRAGTAKKDDFKHIEGILTFNKGEFEKEVLVSVVNDVAFESSEEFYLDLSDAKTGIRLATATIVILDNSDAGTLRFQLAEAIAHEGVKEKTIDVFVVREGGAAGRVTCEWTTQDHTAKANIHYADASGVLEFEQGQMIAKCPLTHMVRVLLSNVAGGAKFDESTDSGAEGCASYVVIQPDPVMKERVNRIHSVMQVNWKNAKSAESNKTAWKNQILDSFKIQEDDEDAEEGSAPPSRPGVMGYITYVVFLFWKVLFAFIPPPCFCGGWLCFGFALAGIGLVTALVGDMASLLGCVAGVPDAITAITLVALGTSLPDTLASKLSATQDPYADNSVGNVTGSNSVNVFLGLGLPWSMGAIYWAVMGASDKWTAKYAGQDYAQDYLKGAFVVEAGDLAFSVGVFTVTAVVCIAMLAVRRKAFGGELGGTRNWAWASSGFLVFMWCIYIGASSAYI
ncbi:unnamed protein product, partial [Polarella glacialis]